MVDLFQQKILIPIGKKRVFQKVVDQLRIAIFRGELNPGDKLPSEETLASQFQVSRSAVREAIRVLDTSGLLYVRRGHGGGTFIRDHDMSSLVPAYTDLLRMAPIEVEEITRSRIVMDSLAIREAAKRMTSREFEALYHNVDDAEKYFRSGDASRRLGANLDFHVMFARYSGMVVLELNVAALALNFSDYLVAIEPSQEMVENTLQSHRQVVKFLEQGAVEDAVAVNREHIQVISDRLILRAKANVLKRTEPQDIQFMNAIDK